MMENQIPITTPAVGDTGLWRLTVDMSAGRLRAWLRRMDSEEAEMQPLADVRWSDDEHLRNIENAVYDNPSVLDDFEADIIVTTPRYLFLPETFAEDYSLCAAAYSQVYGEAVAEDVMISPCGAYICVFKPVAGLRSFLSRTFAGSRVTSHISRLVNFWKSQSKSGLWIYAAVADSRVDIVALRDSRLLCGVSKEWKTDADIFYQIVSVAQSLCGEDLTQLNVALDAPGSISEQLTEMLSPYVLTVCDSGVPGSAEIAPAADRICSFRKTNSPI